MGKLRTERAKIEFGDFQTPNELASSVCQRLASTGFSPRSMVEPTCGVGNLMFAALSAFPGIEHARGLEVNPEYVEQAQSRQAERGRETPVEITCSSFFDHDWPARLAELEDPILFIGNPPWVTSADLGYLNSHNIPLKKNVPGRSGLDALTGKSNFDISEWMLTRSLAWLDGRQAMLAMLCKTAVARKTLAYAWDAGLRIVRSSMHRIDSLKHFGAAVDACLLIVELGERARAQVCPIYASLDTSVPEGSFARRDGHLVANTTLYDRWKHLVGESHCRWRSGIKHDCASLIELTFVDGGLLNGEGERVDVEDRLLYPMLKSSDLAREGTASPRRWMLVPQSKVGEETSKIQKYAPNAWAYLMRNRSRFDRRASSIYRGKPPFSVFGVGDYTFAPWKVAISGLYKKLEFKVVGPHAGKPVVFDDTCYFLACETEPEARFLLTLLESPPAQEFFMSFIFWDSKRPITADLLQRFSLRGCATALGMESDYERLCAHRDPHLASLRERHDDPQLSLVPGDVPAISKRRRIAAKRISS